MEKLKRKFSLLNVPVYEVNDDEGILSIVNYHLDSLDDFICERSIGVYFDCTESINVEAENDVNVMVFTALIGVSESSILFFNNNLLDKISNLDNTFLPVLKVKERNVVDFIEVALQRISNGSIYNNIEIITPESIPDDALVVFIKD